MNLRIRVAGRPTGADPNPNLPDRRLCDAGTSRAGRAAIQEPARVPPEAARSCPRLAQPLSDSDSTTLRGRGAKTGCCAKTVKPPPERPVLAETLGLAVAGFSQAGPIITPTPKVHGPLGSAGGAGGSKGDADGTPLALARGGGHRSRGSRVTDSIRGRGGCHTASGPGSHWHWRSRRRPGPGRERGGGGGTLKREP